MPEKRGRYRHSTVAVSAKADHDDGEFYSDIDQAALELCIEQCKRESPNRKQQIEEMLVEREWSEVAEFCCYCAQSRSLRLKCYQSPPCRVDENGDDDADHYGHGKPAARKLLRQMLLAGLSRFDPTPIESLRAVAGNKDAAAKRAYKAKAKAAGNALHARARKSANVGS